ncbi:MAG TPA: hypothetical protein VG756_22515 [Pseudonocardiaceae bacterium]|jgi:hypothetical protein|nr:hypothetical protein [Pseudonocardiaceae bacterium]
MSRPVGRGALVVFGWGALNAVLALVLVVYSYADPFPLIVYFLAVALIGTFGVAVLLAGRHRVEPERLRIATRSTSAGLLGIAGALIALGFVYGWWLMLFACYPLLLAAVLARKERIGGGGIAAGGDE